MQPIRLELCSSPLCYPAYAASMPHATTIVVDVLRASTTIIEALENGAESMIIVATLEEAKAYADKGYLVGGERNAERFSFAHFGNDPKEYTPELIAGKKIVFTTTNGTTSIHAAIDGGASEVLVGGFVNIPAIARYIVSAERKDVIVLAAGWKGCASSEDCLFAGALVQALLQEISVETASISSCDSLDSTQEKTAAPSCDLISSRNSRAPLGMLELGDAAAESFDLWALHGKTPATRLNYIRRSEHYRRLIPLGITPIVPYCLTPRAEAPVPFVSSVNDLLVATLSK